MNELQMCICRVCSSLKANPKKIEKNNFHFRGLIFRYSERALNSLFGSGLTFARFADAQDLHPETPGMCRLALYRRIRQNVREVSPEVRFWICVGVRACY